MVALSLGSCGPACGWRWFWVSEVNIGVQRRCFLWWQSATCNAGPRAHAVALRAVGVGESIPSRFEGQFFCDASAGEDWRLARQSEMVEDFSDNDAFSDQSDQLAPSAAVITAQDVDGKTRCKSSAHVDLGELDLRGEWEQCVDAQASGVSAQAGLLSLAAGTIRSR